MVKKGKTRKTIKGRFKNRELKIFVPAVYLGFLLLGIILIPLYSVFPSLLYCGEMFGSSFCTPLGMFISLTINLPGYYIAANILKISPNLNIWLSLPLVTVISLVFYFLVGFMVDKLFKSPKSADKISKYIVFTFFVLLVLVFILLK